MTWLKAVPCAAVAKAYVIDRTSVSCKTQFKLLNSMARMHDHAFNPNVAEAMTAKHKCILRMTYLCLAHRVPAAASSFGPQEATKHAPIVAARCANFWQAYVY